MNAGTDLGGTEIMLLRFIERVNTHRFKVSVAALFDRGPFLYEVSRRGFESILFAVKHEWNLLEIAYAFIRLHRFLRSNRIDILHMNGFYTNILGSLTARMAKTPVVITGVRTEVAGQNGYHQILERATAHWIDLYMSVSDESRMQMLRKPWVKDGKVVVVHNGVDPLWARGVLNDEDHKRQTTSNSNPHGIRINSHAPQIGMISAFNRLKAHDILVQAAPAILTKSPKAKFVLMGEGKTKSRITKLIEQKKLSESFILEDFTIDPRCILSQLDIFVLATHTEGLPVSILEAMAFGLPVVASKVGGIPEIVQDGITGILVPPDDPEALASAIIKLLEHPAKAKRMGMLGKLRVKREFGIDKMMEKWVDHYEYLAKRKGII